METPQHASFSALVVDDDPGVRQSLRLCLEADGGRVLGVGASLAALEALERGRFDVILLDLWLGSESGLDAIPDMLRRQPGAAIIVITAFATFDSAVDAMKRGAKDYLPKPFTPEQVRLAVRRALEGQQLERQLRDAEVRLREAGADDDFFETESPTFWNVMKQAARVAAADVPVLLRGESGTGKNVMARWLWQHGPRASGPFVSVNCPSLSRELMTSTLFGHKRGAFTGATNDAAGKVQEAEGGVLFLDEVGDLTLEAQAGLLRFLNDRTYERVGEAKERHADVRLVAATNRGLEDDVKAGRFREDLLFRLNVLSLVMTPLRERREDLSALSAHYLARAKVRQNRSDLLLSSGAERAIRGYGWPGNLRELRNAIERGVILSPGPSIEPEDLGVPAITEGASAGTTSPAEITIGGDVSLDALEREHIARVIARSTTLEAAAKLLGIDSTTLQRKRKRYGLA
ncbi:Response regulator of zinc sigma-54-dependent two-component system [Labilithrix luteola]|uniref:Response regulator of zinc sigma-54-dependent two-component system n=1 Tax=Labilithrix luteola TaxID=1391654 RepID=A0A0K1QF64_9BACT|nr:sigma-54 dependent transcriptional regulator [Labilithrix luteola]AKV04416.1 Response regulator of zinc sigma-54-dependent two-component system [Labilithrix luteola]